MVELEALDGKYGPNGNWKICLGLGLIKFVVKGIKGASTIVGRILDWKDLMRLMQEDLIYSSSIV